MFGKAAAFDVSPPLSALAQSAQGSGKSLPAPSGFDTDREPSLVEETASGSASSVPAASGPSVSAMPATDANFEGLSNQDNFNVFGFRVNPPDPVGDVGPNHYVEMVNLVFAGWLTRIASFKFPNCNPQG